MCTRWSGCDNFAGEKRRKIRPPNFPKPRQSPRRSTRQLHGKLHSRRRRIHTHTHMAHSLDQNTTSAVQNVSAQALGKLAWGEIVQVSPCSGLYRDAKTRNTGCYNLRGPQGDLSLKLFCHSFARKAAAGVLELPKNSPSLGEWKNARRPRTLRRG